MIDDRWYCWWLKSCTTRDVWNPVNNGINCLSTGAGFQPSTVGVQSKPFSSATNPPNKNTAEAGTFQLQCMADVPWAQWTKHVKQWSFKTPPVFCWVLKGMKNYPVTCRDYTIKHYKWSLFNNQYTGMLQDMLQDAASSPIVKDGVFYGAPIANGPIIFGGHVANVVKGSNFCFGERAGYPG